MHTNYSPKFTLKNAHLYLKIIAYYPHNLRIHLLFVNEQKISISNFDNCGIEYILELNFHIFVFRLIFESKIQIFWIFENFETLKYYDSQHQYWHRNKRNSEISLKRYFLSFRNSFRAHLTSFVKFRIKCYCKPFCQNVPLIRNE